MWIRFRSATSIRTTLKAWYARVTRSPITIAFLLFVLANFAAQIVLHTTILLSFSRDRILVTDAINAAGVQRGFTVVQQGSLEICSGIPSVYGTVCHTVYNGSTISAPSNTLDLQCAEGLTWLENYLLNSKSEEVVHLVLQSWLAAISLTALLEESIPNLIVVLAAQIVNTSWISYRISTNTSANQTYHEIIVEGTCGGFDILGGSWQYSMFSVTLAINIAALLCMSSFVWRLIKLYSKSKLSIVGSSPAINRMLKWRLWMRVFHQLATFFTPASAAVWYDKRKSVTMASYYSTNILYDVGFYVVAIIILPWLVLGTLSISKEKRLLFLVYAILSIVLLVTSGLWFGSALFRYEYMAWPTFACVATMADVLLVITCVLSVICRLNFGQGLAHYLVVERKLRASGFTFDTFTDVPSCPWTSSADTQVITIDRPEQLSRGASNQSRSPLRTSENRTSVYSVDSTVVATWLAYTRDEDLKKSISQTEKGERQDSIIIIAREDMRVCDIQSVSTDEENISVEGVDEKQTIIL